MMWTAIFIAFANCTSPLNVDSPASDPAITAAGGTTLPGLQSLCLNAACTPPYWTVNIPNERVWAWDYLTPWCAVLGTPDPVICGQIAGIQGRPCIYPEGSGGGVSVIFPEPEYQSGLPGVELSQPGQVWEASSNAILGGSGLTNYGSETYFALPSNYPGRNVPDVSFNGDPDTGYVIYYASDVTGFSVQTYWGGTSFVAPQLNGVCALLGEELQSRLGLLNYPLYALAQSGTAYKGPNAPLHAIAYGDNWFYYDSQGYNLGVGLGTLDVANFADSLRELF